MRYFIIAALLLTLNTPVFAREVIVALSPYQNAKIAKEEISLIINTFNEMIGGDRMIILDGFNLKTIASLTVPESKRYQSPKARIAKNRKDVAKLVQFIRSISPKTSPSVKLPQILRFAAENYAYNGVVDIIILGSPFYDDPNEPASSMLNRKIPSDGHLNVRHEKSVYGAKDNEEGFKNIRLHIGFNDENIFGSDQHRFYVKRFWALFTSVQGGALTTFTADKGLLFERVIKSAPKPKYNYKQGKETSLEMIRILVATTKKISIFKRALSTQPIPENIIHSARHVEIGISWDQDVDLDLHARPFAGAQALFFNKKSTQYGIHLKDYTVSPASASMYETIIFHKPIDLSNLEIGVYVFSPRKEKLVAATLRIAIGGKVYEHDFTLSTSGHRISSKNIFDSSHSSRAITFKPLDIIQRAQ